MRLAYNLLTTSLTRTQFYFDPQHKEYLKAYLPPRIICAIYMTVIAMTTTGHRTL